MGAAVSPKAGGGIGRAVAASVAPVVATLAATAVAAAAPGGELPSISSEKRANVPRSA
jgi:hypothetical protein